MRQLDICAVALRTWDFLGGRLFSPVAKTSFPGLLSLWCSTLFLDTGRCVHLSSLMLLENAIMSSPSRQEDIGEILRCRPRSAPLPLCARAQSCKKPGNGTGQSEVTVGFKNCEVLGGKSPGSQHTSDSTSPCDDACMSLCGHCAKSIVEKQSIRLLSYGGFWVGG